MATSITFDTTSGVTTGAFRAFLAFPWSPVSAPAAASRIVSVLRASPPREPDDPVDGFIVYAYLVLQPMLAGDGASDERLEVRWLQRFEFDDHGTAEQWLDDGETRIFSGGAAMNVTSLFSTLGSNASCWDLENPVHLVNDTAPSLLAFGYESVMCAFEHIAHVLTPEVTADNSSNTRPDCLATI